MSDRPIIIAGPCAAENMGMLDEVAGELSRLAGELELDLYFKASFDKANRTSAGAGRGAGMASTLKWLGDLKEKYGFKILSDVHESHQAEPAAEVCDALQIPAFLCRQTDLVAAAVKSCSRVNIKKGQFLAPDSMQHLAAKARESNPATEVWLTERGASFGYGDLVLDMRSFPIMAQSGCPVILDITHSTQRPAASGQASSGGQRQFAPIYARAAAATGYVDGFFLEVHPDPAQAISDKDAQLSIPQATTLLRQLIPFWREARSLSHIDGQF